MNEQIVACIEAYLNGLCIPYDRLRHPPAGAMEDLREAARALDAVIPKNLFLTPRNQSAFYLCLTMPGAAFQTACVSKQIGSSRLSFAGEAHLDALLHTHPGAVSPLGLIFDAARPVELLVDARLLDAPRLGFHPNDNTQTFAMRAEDFFNAFLKSLGRTARWVHI